MAKLLSSIIIAGFRRVITTRGRDADDLHRSVAETDGRTITNYYDNGGGKLNARMQVIINSVDSSGMVRDVERSHWKSRPTRQYSTQRSGMGRN